MQWVHQSRYFYEKVRLLQRTDAMSVHRELTLSTKDNLSRKDASLLQRLQEHRCLHKSLFALLGKIGVSACLETLLRCRRLGPRLYRGFSIQRKAIRCTLGCDGASWFARSIQCRVCVDFEWLEACYLMDEAKAGGSPWRNSKRQGNPRKSACLNQKKLWLCREISKRAKYDWSRSSRGTSIGWFHGFFTVPSKGLILGQTRVMNVAEFE